MEYNYSKRDYNLWLTQNSLLMLDKGVKMPLFYVCVLDIIKNNKIKVKNDTVLRKKVCSY